MQKNILIALIAVLILAVFPMISAATMTTPVTGGNYTTSPFTVTVVVTGNGGNNMTNVSCWYNQTGGAHSTHLVDILNTTSYQTTFTGSATLTTDLRTYNVTCFVYNGTSLNTTLSATSVTVEGGFPSVILTKESTDVNMNGLQKLTWSSTDATSGVYSTSVTLTSPDSAICPTQTWTDNTKTSYIIPEQYLACPGEYTVAMTVIDFASNSVDATSLTFDVNAPGAMAGSSVGSGSSGVPAVSGVISGPGLGQKKTQNISWNTIIIIGLGIFVGWYLLKKK